MPLDVDQPLARWACDYADRLLTLRSLRPQSTRFERYDYLDVKTVDNVAIAAAVVSSFWARSMEDTGEMVDGNT